MANMWDDGGRLEIGDQANPLSLISIKDILMNNHVLALTNALQNSGYRLTATRQAIIETLVAGGGHVTADELAEQVRVNAPQVGRMTVYRTLELLSDLGLIRPIFQGTGAAHYILLDNGRHHHLICTRCHTVFEFDECVGEEIGKTIGSRYDFIIQGHLLEFYGLCAQCQV